ncbi:TRAP transporter small permease subunit [Litorimonas sp. RW-G-Af-16]|uniref:TRAP transporter small permease subunit n=1 Tax=Litorimonas sp. RW-G-Af-16 TaxID=3241168 RepID=UPI00390CDA35
MNWAAMFQTIGWAFLPVLALPLLYLIWPEAKLLQSLSRALIRTIDSAVNAIGEIVKWALPALVLSVAASVFALSIFGVTTTKLLESAGYFQAIIITLGAAATLLAGQHVRVDIFHAKMGPKAKSRVDLIGFYALLLPSCLLILWNSQSFVGFAWRIFEGSSEADGIKGVFLLKTLIPIFAVSMIVQALAISLRAAMCLAGQTRPERPIHIDPFFHTAEGDAIKGSPQ